MFDAIFVAQTIPSVPIPPSGHLSSCRFPGGGKFVTKLLPGVGHLSILLEELNVVPFLIFHLKICPFRQLKNNYTLKRYVWFSHSTFCIRLGNCFPHRDQFAHGVKTIKRVERKRHLFKKSQFIVLSLILIRWI